MSIWEEFSFNMFLVLAPLFILVGTINSSLVINYQEKIVSQFRSDNFGYFVASRDDRLVIGAPTNNSDEGYVLVNGKYLRNPNPKDLKAFGVMVAVNKEYIYVLSHQYSYNKRHLEHV